MTISAQACVSAERPTHRLCASLRGSPPQAKGRFTEVHVWLGDNWLGS